MVKLWVWRRQKLRGCTRILKDIQDHRIQSSQPFRRFTNL